MTTDEIKARAHRLWQKICDGAKEHGEAEDQEDEVFDLQGYLHEALTRLSDEKLAELEDTQRDREVDEDPDEEDQS